MSNEIRNLVIVGGGTAGWMAAAALAKAQEKLQNKILITLIEAPDISTVGVGEATIPPIVNFLHYLGIDERDFMRETQATFKLAIKFEDWLKKGSAFYHPFGSVGVNINNQDFYTCWQQVKNLMAGVRFEEFSPAAQLCVQESFYHPATATKDSFLAGVAYAYHFDAGLAARYLSRYALTKGVLRVSDTVGTVQKDKRNFITAVKLNSGKTIYGDFFIDCTGFRALLIDQNLSVGFESWSQFLPCNRAVVVQSIGDGKCLPYTRAKALEEGWMWNIPLQHRVGNGYVYDADLCSDDEALRKLESHTSGRICSEPRIIPFTTGKRKQIWYKNCLALGLSAGFLEPLESTAIHLITRGIRAFLDYFPDKNCDPNLANEYNRILAQDYVSVRDFIVLHYCTSQRGDSEFWKRCQQMSIPDSLEKKLSLFRARGLLEARSDEFFRPPSWHSIFEGMQLQCADVNPLHRITEPEKIIDVCTQTKTLMQEMASSLPKHKHFLHNYCSTEKKKLHAGMHFVP